MPQEKWKKLKSRLGNASREKDRALRGIKVAAVIAEALRTVEIDSVLVGGSAVAFYTEGKYTTQDIDMIALSGKETEQIMTRLGFSKLGKDYTNKQLNLYVEFPSESLGPTEQTNTIHIDRVPLKIISPEDIIVDRLCAFKYWKSAVDGINVLMILESGIANKKRVEDRAREEDVLDALDYIEDVLETVIRKNLSPSEASHLLKKFFG